jgi:hypothetical protein
VLKEIVRIFIAIAAAAFTSGKELLDKLGEKLK